MESRLAVQTALCVLAITLPAVPVMGNGPYAELYDDDLNFITGAEPDAVRLLYTFWEDYGEDNRVPYPSHDGWAVVDHDAGEEVRYFDKGVFWGYPGMPPYISHEFVVTNVSPFTWSDYHFELWALGPGSPFAFDAPLTRVPTSASDTSGFFEHVELGAGYVNFWTDGPGVAPSETVTMLIDFGPPETQYLGLRQIATTTPSTIPEPSTVVIWSLLIGFAGISLRRRRR